VRRRTPTLALSAPLVLALCCGTASPAIAAPHKAATHEADTHKAKPKDPLAGARTKAIRDITVYGKRLAVVLKAGSASTLLSADELGSLHDAGVLQGVAQRDDRVAVMRAKGKKQIVAAVAAAARTVQVAGLELNVSVAAETHLAAGGDVSDAVATLTDDATTAAAAGDDTSDLTDALDDVAVDLESAQGDESSAVSDVMTLDNAATTAALKAAAANAGDDLALIDQDISDADDDLATAQSADDDLSSDDGSGDSTDPGDGSTDPGDGF
jgi:hypothetical protein